MYKVKNKIILDEFESNFIKENFKNGIIWCARRLGLSKDVVSRCIVESGLVMTKEEKIKCRSGLLIRPNEKCGLKIETFLNLTNPNLIYFLGYFWADGHVRNDCNSFSMAILKDDMDNIRPILDSLGEWDYKDMVRKNRKTITCARATNKLIKDWFVENDFKIKSFVEPTKILSKIPQSLHHYWFRGYLDGDGSITKAAGYGVCFAAPIDYSWNFMIDLCKRIDARGFSIQKKIGKRGRGSIFVGTSKDGVLRLLQYIYNGYENEKIGLERKYKNFFNQMVKGVYRGECIWPVNNKFRVGITMNGSQKHIGYFDSRKEAMEAYNDFIDKNNLYCIKQVYREGITKDTHTRRSKV